MTRDPLVGPIPGVVASRDDPEKRGRVTVRVPGLFEAGAPDRVSPWAEPLNADKGAGRGTASAPDVGSEVVVFPVYDAQLGQGDPDVLYYLPGNHGDGDVPDEYEDVDMHVFASRDYVVVIDERLAAERQGQPTVRVVHRASGDGLSHDAETLTAQVSATARVEVSSAARVDVTAGVILLNGRLVLPGGPIR